ncbi:MAG: hypothetical protein WDM76_06530 [Limisphaerales bacterium]
MDWISLDSYNRMANSWGEFFRAFCRDDHPVDKHRSRQAHHGGGNRQLRKIGHDKGQWFLNALTNYLPNGSTQNQSLGLFQYPQSTGWQRLANHHLIQLARRLSRRNQIVVLQHESVGDITESPIQTVA